MNDAKPKTLYEGRHLSMLNQDGWEYASRSTSRPAVGVVAFTGAGEIVLVEQHRPPVGQTVTELPAGLSGDIAGSEDEPLLEAAKRELFEETGYVASSWSELVSCFTSPGLTDESITIFFAQGLDKEGPGGGDQSEKITVHEIPFDEVLPWLRTRGATADLKLLAGLFAASEHLRRKGMIDEP